MRIVVLVLALLGLLAANAAPGDQYFGKMKMSALRIRYVFNQLRPQYERHEILPEAAQHDADMAQDAYYAWAHAYPKDPWLPSTAYLMVELYRELPGESAHASTLRALKFIEQNFPHTSYATKAAADLHRGVPVVADPAWAIAMRERSPSPSPSAPPCAAASALPSAAPGASPGTSPAASPSPCAPSAAPSPSSSSPASPSPSPSPSRSPR